MLSSVLAYTTKIWYKGRLTIIDDEERVWLGCHIPVTIHQTLARTKSDQLDMYLSVAASH